MGEGWGGWREDETLCRLFLLPLFPIVFLVLPLTTCDKTFFFKLKGKKERLIAGYLLYETDETLLKDTKKPATQVSWCSIFIKSL